MKATIRISLILLSILIFPALRAQENLSISKVIHTSSQDEKIAAVNNLKLWLIGNTNAHVCGSCQKSEKVIIDGQMPLILSNNSFDLAYQFNGLIDYRLIIDYSTPDIQLTFKNLQHESYRSINGLNLNYGNLLSDGHTSQKAVFNNFNFLLEDFSRIKRFETDSEMAKRITEATILAVDGILAER